MFGNVSINSYTNSNSAFQSGRNFSNRSSAVTAEHERVPVTNTSDFICENSAEFLVVEIPPSTQYSQHEFQVENSCEIHDPSDYSNHAKIDMDKDSPSGVKVAPPEDEMDTGQATNSLVENVESTNLSDPGEHVGNGSVSNDATTVGISNSAEYDQDFNSSDNNSDQIIHFQGDLRDYTNDRRGQSPQRAFEPGFQGKLQVPSENGQNDMEELEEGPSSLYDALIQPYYSTRYRLKSLALAVSRSLPSSPRVRIGQKSSPSRYSQGTMMDFGSKSHRLKEGEDDVEDLNPDAETLIVPTILPSMYDEESNQEERPKSTSPKRPRTSQVSISSVKSVKTSVTKSTSVVDVSNGLSTLSPMQQEMPSRSHPNNNLPRSTSTPGLASNFASSAMSRSPPRFSTGGSLRDMGGQPWSLSRAESLAEQNGFQHCIVCRACSSRAKQIRPGRHFVLSWKQIIAMIFALSVYIAGGTLLFIQLEYTAETKRQDNFIRFFEGFVANHSCVQPSELLYVADTLLTDPNLAVLMLKEISANHQFFHEQSTTQFPDFTDEDKQGPASIDSELHNSTSDTPNIEFLDVQNSSGCLRNLNISLDASNFTNSSSRCNIWTSTARIWNVPNSLGFVISALTTIGYGLIVPRTAAGRLTCVAYGIVGIPLMLLFLGGIGEKMRRMTSRFIMRKRIFPCGKRFNQALNCSLLGMAGIMLLFMIPSIAFVYMEGWSVADAVYYCFISLSTIGFGDLMLGDPTSSAMLNKGIGHQLYRLVSLVWVLFGLAYVGMCITSLAHLIIRGSCGANNVETMRLKAELKRLKHEIRAQRMYTRRSGLAMWTSQMVDRDGGRWDFDHIAEDGDGQKY
ncbi:potassium channel subfamily K member 16 [Elysia marginata]|uniref:Potassium channel subfamily K member 16 n=1 Tax=Elysia marginata TaxID=1093978 RepID=A0AAV4IID1_9GAST|nr:potassium channel subfamily K member 16 [Elysia marginata]